jgi:hypothetical protein
VFQAKPRRREMLQARVQDDRRNARSLRLRDIKRRLSTDPILRRLPFCFDRVSSRGSRNLHLTTASE